MPDKLHIVDGKHFVVYLSLNVHNLLMIKFSGIVTSKFTIGAIVLLTLKNVTSIQSKTLERIDKMFPVNDVELIRHGKVRYRDP